MTRDAFDRRTWLRRAAGLAGAGLAGWSQPARGEWAEAGAPRIAAAPPVWDTAADRERRMRWWHAARFGMFIHFGLYSLLGEHEWAMDREGIPIPQYERLAQHFNPHPHAARAWARLAREAGQKYMVMTTKHHEGFCLWDTKLTNYCAPRQACGRDLVREYVDAARAEGLRVGFYYSLMDWHHPDGYRCKSDPAARRRFVEYTHGLIRELMTQYGKIDVLWYDVHWPLNAREWESEKMNQMVFSLQPDIIVNNRNGLAGDFSTPEQHIQAAQSGRAWETCMTINDSWGYQRADRDFKTPATLVRNLITCAGGGGNYLLNIGPRGDGSAPEPEAQALRAVGRWMARNGETIYGSDRCNCKSTPFASFTRKGNTLYVQVHSWPGRTPGSRWMPFFRPPAVAAIGGLRTKALSARVLKTGQKVAFRQDDLSVQLTGLPAHAPDAPVSVIAVECAGEPRIDPLYVREHRQRYKVGVSWS